MTDTLTLASFGLAFGAGLISVLSPCVMPLMPAYLSLISGISVDDLRDEGLPPDLRRRVLLGCTGFVAGFSTVFVLLGASATAVGRTIKIWHVEILGLSIGTVQLAGLVIIAMGLHLMGWLPIRALYRDTRFQRLAAPRSLLGTWLVGAAFAFGWSPCVGPILGGILTVAGSRETVWSGMALLAVYSMGLAVPFYLAGWSIEFFFRWLERMKGHFQTVERVSGALLLGLGFLVLSNQLTALNQYFVFLNRLVQAAEQWLL